MISDVEQLWILDHLPISADHKQRLLTELCLERDEHTAEMPAVAASLPHEDYPAEKEPTERASHTVPTAAAPTAGTLAALAPHGP